MENGTALQFVAADVEAEVVVCEEGLSFWGGVDPDTGQVIDAHHHLHGELLADKIVVMPTSRGSCSGSGVLLQLALNGRAPAALVFRDDEEVLTLGAVIASRMFGRAIGVVRLPADHYGTLRSGQTARLREACLSTGSMTVDLRLVNRDDLDLTAADKAMLDGMMGIPAALAMEVICAMAACHGAARLTDFTRGHIDGCIYAHEANLIFAEAMAEMGAKVDTAEGGKPPLKITGKQSLNSISYQMPMASAQVKSCCLLAGMYADGKTCVTEPAVTRDHTERMLKAFGCDVEVQGLSLIHISEPTRQ